MTRLNCTARACVNNEGGLCGAGYILIEGGNSSTSAETFCNNFREDTFGEHIKAIGNTNYAGELMQIFSSTEEIKMSPEVSCHATKCFYNGNGKCEARDISIMGDGANEPLDTRCETFIE